MPSMANMNLFIEKKKIICQIKQFNMNSNNKNFLNNSDYLEYVYVEQMKYIVRE